jgi:hypothetical protein
MLRAARRNAGLAPKASCHGPEIRATRTDAGDLVPDSLESFCRHRLRDTLGGPRPRAVTVRRAPRYWLTCRLVIFWAMSEKASLICAEDVRS